MYTLRRGLREFVVEAGTQALEVLLEDERTQLCGPRYQHDAARQAMRSGHAPGELVMGGRKVHVSRPRVRTVDDTQELPLPSWRLFSMEDPLEREALEKMLVGVSTRKYRRALDAVPPEVDDFAMSKSAVKDHLPDELHASVAATMHQAYAMRDFKKAKLQLENLARRLDEEYPSAASSVREGLSETLTVIKLGLSSTFARTFATTNPIENLNGTARRTCRNVKRWQGGTMIMRWCCAAMKEAQSRFRRVRAATTGMPVLLAALRENDRLLDNVVDPAAAAG